MFDGYRPFVIKCFYWNLNQEMGTWFDVYPNEDLEGQYFFPDHKDCGWLIHVRINPNGHGNIYSGRIRNVCPGTSRLKRCSSIVSLRKAVICSRVFLAATAGLVKSGVPTPESGG